ncbi:OmpP1/FadL family transporter [Maribacter sp. LLG6340-A2]|uniref:OmpP1/FadL family transporter n=1 Tax=Maribacter sp. LLG6340-A2 TaxID=3160834 RepID=UPI0038676E11
MMRKNNLYTLLLILSITLYHARAQSEALTSSPYSLYGLGVINQTSIGKFNGLGYSGIGTKSVYDLNNLNPATYALISQNSFLYDIGVTGEINNYSNKTTSENKSIVNFSNLAFGFRIAENFGGGISLVPYSDVGYSILGVNTNIEGSTQTFESNITGIGGLSDIRLNLGYAFNDRFRIGMNASFLFGNIEENESFTYIATTFESTEKTNYNGARIGFGMQWDILDNITVGATAQLPMSLNGQLKRSVIKNLYGSEINVEDEKTDNVADFKLPLELGFGLSLKPIEQITLSADYKKNFWSNTNQTENIGTYTDQDIYAFGLEYVKNPSGHKYNQRIRYRLGYNYDNGYLNIANKKVEGYNITAGIGIPTSRGTHSMINLSYSYGSKGILQNVLVKENYHLISLNLSLEDLWFVKRKVN